MIVDELERRIRAANPDPTNRHMPLSERAERELTLLLATPRDLSAAKPLPKRWVTIMAATIVAVVAILLTVGLPNLLSPRPAAASTPPILETTPVAGSPVFVLERLSELARTSPAETRSADIAAETWSAELTPTTHKVTFVQPRDIVRTRENDKSGSVIIRAGQVRWGMVGEGEKPAIPGTQLERFDYGPGAFPMLFPVPPPTDPAALSDYLAKYLGVDASAGTGELFRAVQDLRNEWELDGSQSAALLNLLAERNDIEVLGNVTDRLGRAGTALATDSRMGGAFRDILIFATATARLLSAEEVYLGGIPDIQLTPPIVMNYIAWKDTP